MLRMCGFLLAFKCGRHFWVLIKFSFKYYIFKYYILKYLAVTYTRNVPRTMMFCIKSKVLLEVSAVPVR